METISSLSSQFGISRKRLQLAVRRLGMQKTGRDYVLDEGQVSALFREISNCKMGHPSLENQARRRLFRLLGPKDSRAVELLIESSENSRGELRWLINGSEEAIRDRLNRIRKIQEEKGPVARAST